MKYLLLGLLFVSCAKVPTPKYRIGDCLKNPIYEKVKIDSIDKMIADGYMYTVSSLDNSRFRAYEESYLDLNEYKKVPCKEQK